MMKSMVLLICLVAAVELVATAESKSEEQAKDIATPNSDASDRLVGKKTGQVRNDNALEMKLVWCAPGKFAMASPSNQLLVVSLTTGYWLGKYEVTQSEWKSIIGNEPWKNKSYAMEGADCAATYISWNDAMQFCRKLTEQERMAGRLPTAWEYTLPTEAQWERACRANTETKFSFGDDESKLGDYAWYKDNAFEAGERYAHRVGQRKANTWGFHDMHGNVSEWCRDVYVSREELPGGLDPEVKPKTKLFTRVLRGGGWQDAAAWCRSGDREWDQPDHRGNYVGIRVALSPVEQAK